RSPPSCWARESLLTRESGAPSPGPSTCSERPATGWPEVRTRSSATSSASECSDFPRSLGWTRAFPSPSSVARSTRRSSPARNHQAALVSLHDELRSVPCAELGQQVADVRLHRRHADLQHAGDLSVRPTRGHLDQDLAL